MKEFAPDTFTENDVLACLDRAGLKYQNRGSKYIISQCPTHDDKHPSTQIFKDDWFVNCLAGCGRYHITKAFPELLPERDGQPRPERKQRMTTKPEAPKYKEFDLIDWWKELPEIPRDHKFKTIPLDVLDSLGWRWDPDKQSYFIPYWDRSQKHIPFGQWRHLTGERRFTFLAEARPIAYGLQNLDPSNSPLFVVEGASDCAVLDYAAVPWIGMPSASSGELMKGLARYCKKEGIQLVYAGDNDAAGDKLREALDEIMPYRVKQPRSPYKDWGDMLEAEGIESVQNYCFEELEPPKKKDWDEMSPVEKVQDVFPGAKELEMVGGSDEKKQLETSEDPPVLF